jgi:hypothetical protein
VLYKERKSEQEIPLRFMIEV